MPKISYLIVANGEKLSANRLRKLALNRVIIACDGALDECLQHGIHPDRVLGDFDSSRLLCCVPDDMKAKMQVLYTPDQNKTDSEKALLHAIENNASDIILCQAIGSRTDHSLINLGLLARYHNNKHQLALAREDEVIRYLENESVTICGSIGDPVGLLGFPTAIVTTSGLTYECRRLKIDLIGDSSGCNSLAATTANIDIIGQAIMTTSE